MNSKILNSPQNPWLFRLSLLTTVLALIVIMFGAYVRLSHAGLGCPDWPGCYGKLTVPQTPTDLAHAAENYPERPVETSKAWQEMIHRYLASLLGFLILLITALAWRSYGIKQAVLPNTMLVLVIFQGMLGMWTVTWLLKPLIVTAHLLGGMSLVSLLWWLTLQQSGWQLISKQAENIQTLRRLSILCIVLLFVQIALGGWVSTNYAALACYGFPLCSGHWWPNMEFNEAFILWHGLGINYEGGILDHPTRVAIHMTHRIGALLVSTAIILLLLKLLRQKCLQGLALLAGSLLTIQIMLGITNVTAGLPLWSATAHNGIAALLLLSLWSILFFLSRPQRD